MTQRSVTLPKPYLLGIYLEKHTLFLLLLKISVCEEIMAMLVNQFMNHWLMIRERVQLNSMEMEGVP